MAYEILRKMPVPSLLPHELGVGFSKWTVSKRTQFWFLVYLLQNHYQWQSKSAQIKLKAIVACGSEMSIAIPSTGLFGGFFQAGSAMLSGVWKGNLGSVSLCCLSQSVWGRIDFLHWPKCERHRNFRIPIFLFWKYNIKLWTPKLLDWWGVDGSFFILEKKIGMANNTCICT